MSIKTTCPHCGHKATFNDGAAGKKAKCGKCAKTFSLSTNLPALNNHTATGSKVKAKALNRVSDDEIDWEALSEIERDSKSVEQTPRTDCKGRQRTSNSKSNRKTKQAELREVHPLAIYVLGSLAVTGLGILIGLLALSGDARELTIAFVPLLLFLGPVFLAIGKNMAKQNEDMGCLLALIYGPIVFILPIVEAIIGTIIFTPLMAVFDVVARYAGYCAREPWDDFSLGVQPRANEGRTEGDRSETPRSVAEDDTTYAFLAAVVKMLLVTGIILGGFWALYYWATSDLEKPGPELREKRIKEMMKRVH